MLIEFDSVQTIELQDGTVLDAKDNNTQYVQARRCLTFLTTPGEYCAINLHIQPLHMMFSNWQRPLAGFRPILMPKLWGGINEPYDYMSANYLSCFLMHFPSLSNDVDWNRNNWWQWRITWGRHGKEQTRKTWSRGWNKCCQGCLTTPTARNSRNLTSLRGTSGATSLLSSIT